MLRNRMNWLKALALGTVISFAAPARAADLDKMTPDDAQFVAVINVRQALESPLAKKKGFKDKLKDFVDANNEAKQILGALGLDLTKDIDSILVAGADPSADKPDKVLVVVRGSFDPAKLAGIIEKSDKVKVSKEGTATIYEMKGEGETFFVTIVNKTTVVGAGSKEYLLKGLKGSTTAGSKDLIKASAKVDGKQAAWGAMVITEKMKTDLANNQQLKAFAAKWESSTFGVAVTDSIVIDVNLITTDKDTPTAMKKQLDAVMPFIKAAVGSDPNVGPIVGDVLDGLKITDNQNVLNVNLKVTEKTVNDILKLTGLSK